MEVRPRASHPVTFEVQGALKSVSVGTFLTWLAWSVKSGFPGRHFTVTMKGEAPWVSRGKWHERSTQGG